MRGLLARRRALENHPGLKQVDRLLSGRPDEVEVPIAGLPGQLDKLFSIYECLFELRDYRIAAVDRRLDDLWIARVTRRQLPQELITGPASLGSTGRR